MRLVRNRSHIIYEHTPTRNDRQIIIYSQFKILRWKYKHLGKILKCSKYILLASVNTDNKGNSIFLLLLASYFSFIEFTLYKAQDPLNVEVT